MNWRNSLILREEKVKEIGGKKDKYLGLGKLEEVVFGRNGMIKVF